MDISKMVTEIDGEIARLQQARALLAGSQHTAMKRGPGRPKNNTMNLQASAAPKRGTISAEGRKRIAEAMKKRWAEKKRAAKKTTI